jgi:hypothetical protein
LVVIIVIDLIDRITPKIVYSILFYIIVFLAVFLFFSVDINFQKIDNFDNNCNKTESIKFNKLKDIYSCINLQIDSYDSVETLTTKDLMMVGILKLKKSQIEDIFLSNNCINMLLKENSPFCYNISDDNIYLTDYQTNTKYELGEKDNEYNQCFVNCIDDCVSYIVYPSKNTVFHFKCLFICVKEKCLKYF